MTVHQLHDALSLLPADLVAEADKKRSNAPKVIVWRRYAAMAACFVLVLGSAVLAGRLLAPAAKESAAPQTVAEESLLRSLKSDEETLFLEESPAEAVCEDAMDHLTTDTTNSIMVSGSMLAPLYPGISLLQQLEAVPGNTSACFPGNPIPSLLCSRADLDAYCHQAPQRFQPGNLIAACKNYDDAWFAEYDLLLITLCGIPASRDIPITAIRHENGQWQFFHESYGDDPEAARKDCHYLFRLEKGLIQQTESIHLLAE